MVWASLFFYFLAVCERDSCSLNSSRGSDGRYADILRSAPYQKNCGSGPSYVSTGAFRSAQCCLSTFRVV